MDEKNVVPSLSLVLKSIVQGGHVYFKTEIEQFRVYCLGSKISVWYE